MQAFKTEGIVLKRRDFGEADRILIVFTLHRGKVAVVAKGVRRITSRRAGNVELLNRVSMFLYPGRRFWNLTEASSLDTYQKLKEDLTLSTYSFHILELIDRLTVEDQENRILYELLVQILERLSRKPRQTLIRAFEAKMLTNLGFASFEKGELLGDLAAKSWDEIEKMEISKREALELEQTLRYHVERIIEGKLRSRQFLKKIHG